MSDWQCCFPNVTPGINLPDKIMLHVISFTLQNFYFTHICPILNSNGKYQLYMSDVMDHSLCLMYPRGHGK